MLLKTDFEVPNEHLLEQRGIQISLSAHWVFSGPPSTALFPLNDSLPYFSFLDTIKRMKEIRFFFFFLATFKLFTVASLWVKLNVISSVIFLLKMTDIRRTEKLPGM